MGKSLLQEEWNLKKLHRSKLPRKNCDARGQVRQPANSRWKIYNVYKVLKWLKCSRDIYLYIAEGNFILEAQDRSQRQKRLLFRWIRGSYEFLRKR